MKLKFTAAFTAITESFSKAVNVSTAADKRFCFKNTTALLISNSIASLAYSEFFIAPTHQSYPEKKLLFIRHQIKKKKKKSK